jgi:glycosyltransferase involved in cell wall biosynthesis
VGVWTSGVSETLFNPEHYVADRSRFREKLGLNGKFVIFYHGVFSHTRGLMETVDAMKILAPKYPDIIFFLLGTGPLAPKLEESTQDMVIHKNVIVAKPVGHSAVPRFISMCDVGIIPLPDHPYWRFQSPLKLLEYLAMKKPVILTDIPAHRAIVDEAKCGVYVSSVKPTQIAEAIEYAYRNRHNLEEWGEIGIEIVRKTYTWSKVAKDLENYLNSIDN